MSIFRLSDIYVSVTKLILIFNRLNMKNVLFIAAFALGGVIGIGQATNPQNREITEQMDPSQDGYTEVNVEDLTEDITMSLGK